MSQDYGIMIPVPRWRLVVETGHGWEELTAEEKRLAWDYLCTDQTPAMLEQYRAVARNIGRQLRERMDAAVMEVLR